jgi:hypothetical protein
MKLHTYLLPAVAALMLSACEDKPKPVDEKIKDKVDDALDRRPNEKLKDAGEDIKDAAKDVKDEVNDAAKDTKDAVKDATR